MFNSNTFHCLQKCEIILTPDQNATDFTKCATIVYSRISDHRIKANYKIHNSEFFRRIPIVVLSLLVTFSVCSLTCCRPAACTRSTSRAAVWTTCTGTSTRCSSCSACSSRPLPTPSPTARSSSRAHLPPPSPTRSSRRRAQAQRRRPSEKEDERARMYLSTSSPRPPSSACCSRCALVARSSNPFCTTCSLYVHCTLQCTAGLSRLWLRSQIWLLGPKFLYKFCIELFLVPL